jgi:hypothetical protein
VCSEYSTREEKKKKIMRETASGILAGDDVTKEQIKSA